MNRYHCFTVTIHRPGELPREISAKLRVQDPAPTTEVTALNIAGFFNTILRFYPDARHMTFVKIEDAP